LAIGCSQQSSKPAAGGDAQAQVKAAFEDVQKALLAKDTDKIWGLLDDDSHKHTDRVAKEWQAKWMADYDMADADKVQKEIGLSPDELANLTGKTFVKTKGFLTGPIDELAKGKFDKATVTGDSATVYYTEPDDDKEKRTMTRVNGQWKIRLVPKGPK
jgi:hypothetical protein